MKSRIAVIGRNGRLGAALCKELSEAYDILPLSRQELDLEQPIRKQLQSLEFDLLINAAAATGVDWCEEHPPKATLINSRAVAELAQICTERRVRMVHVSTDYVFEGSKGEPYKEDDIARPINVYGESKRLGEEAVLRSSDRHLVVRVSWVFGHDKPSFVDSMLNQAATKPLVEAVDDKFSVPTYTNDLVEWLRPCLFDIPLTGIVHLCNGGHCSWREFAQCAIDAADREDVPLNSRTVHPVSLESMTMFVARRPVYTVMSTERFSRLTGIYPRPWQEAVQEFVHRKFRPAS
jgi:dTDP-4-dehydrorhamnose reductase